MVAYSGSGFRLPRNMIQYRNNFYNQKNSKPNRAIICTNPLPQILTKCLISNLIAIVFSTNSKNEIAETNANRVFSLPPTKVENGTKSCKSFEFPT